MDIKVAGTFQVEQIGDTMVLTPQINLGELEYGRIEQAGKSVLQWLEEGEEARNLVVDFALTDYCGSTALGFFLRAWSRARARGGHMAFCNMSPHELEILELMRLDALWSVCDTRDEALAAVNSPPGGE